MELKRKSLKNDNRRNIYTQYFLKTAGNTWMHK